MTSRVMRYERSDAGGLKPARRHDNGWLSVEGRISRIGVQVYQTRDGKERRELRLPEDVFDAASLASFKQVPVTNNHPPEMLDAANTKKYLTGTVGEDVRSDGDFVAASLTLYDAAAIAAIEAGRSQLSCGYSCELEETSGIWRGQPYDVVQRNIRGNHVATVDAARAGPLAALRLDSGDAAMITSEQHREMKTMAQIKIDGFSFETTDANAQAAHDRAVAAAKKAGEDLAATASSRADAAETAKQVAADALVELQAKYDLACACVDAAKARMVECDACMDGKRQGKTCNYCDGKGRYRLHDMHGAPDATKDVLDALATKRRDSFSKLIAEDVTERVKVEVSAVAHLGADFKFDGLSNRDVKIAVIAKQSGEDAALLATASDVYLQGRYDSAVAQVASKGPTASDKARAGVITPPVKHEDAKPTDLQAASRAYIARAQSAWKTNKAGA